MTFDEALEALGFVYAGRFSGRHDRPDGMRAHHCHDLVRMEFYNAVVIVKDRRTASTNDPDDVARIVRQLEAESADKN